MTKTQIKFGKGWKQCLSIKQELHHYWAWSIIVVPVTMVLINTL